MFTEICPRENRKSYTPDTPDKTICQVGSIIMYYSVLQYDMMYEVPKLISKKKNISHYVISHVMTKPLVKGCWVIESHRLPMTTGCRSQGSSVLAWVILKATRCRSEMPTSMSSSMPISSPVTAAPISQLEVTSCSLEVDNLFWS